MRINWKWFATQCSAYNNVSTIEAFRSPTMTFARGLKLLIILDENSRLLGIREIVCVATRNLFHSSGRQTIKLISMHISIRPLLPYKIEKDRKEWWTNTLRSAEYMLYLTLCINYRWYEWCLSVAVLPFHLCSALIQGHRVRSRHSRTTPYAWIRFAV